MKRCGACTKILDIDSFGLDSFRKDKLTNNCKNCQKISRIKRKAKIAKSRKKHRKKNMKNIIKQASEYVKQRRKTDLNFHLKLNINAALHRYLKRQDETTKSLDLLGCTIPQLKQHLESKFQPGMTWENYGVRGWHIDHIKPLVLFDFTDIQQIKEANHFTNLQPLWAIDNIKKGCKYEPGKGK